MANDNYVMIIGNLSRDPELRFSNAGTAILGMGIAYNERRKNKQTGEWEDGDPSFFNVTAFGQMAENIASSCTKGMRVLVTGRLKYRSWEDNEGNRRQAVDIIADEVTPSLRWSTVSVERSERSKGSGSGNYGGGGGQQRYYDDDDPF